ncbi:MAG TPA: ATP synthase F0 subunit B [Pyrinomonadaceae bacterium]|nr:ATP synthase F0 subunit B [Pyrinomonadaceae bacterium]
MLALISSIILLTAETGGHASEGGFTSFYQTYLNYPGFELWKFINLGIFVLLMIYLLKKPLSEQFKAKRESIRADLIKAEQEKQSALSQLTTTETKLASLEQEKALIVQRSREEAEAEKNRIAAEAEDEIKKLHDQAANELTRLSQQTRAELRRLAAEESIRLAEQRLRSQINPENDGRLVKASIDAIGGLN